MPYDDHVRVTVSGQLGLTGSGYEKFAWGFAIGGSFISDALADDVVDAVEAYFSDPGTFVHGSAKMTQVKFASIDADGHYVGVPYVVASTVVGGGADTIHPPQVSWCVSVAAVPDPGDPITPSGRRRGRWYLPLPVPAIDSATGEVSDRSTAATLASNTVAFIEATNAAIGGPAIVVASSIDGNHTINQVRVGRALDTIRSRRRDLLEDYAIGVVTP